MSDVGKIPTRWRRRARRRWILHYAQVICAAHGAYRAKNHHAVAPCAGCIGDADVIYRYRRGPTGMVLAQVRHLPPGEPGKEE